ncbi:MAG TPA: hypothetical protein VMT28_12145 [Terriglobales bacterium]|nr:hypothetical protein [Terriglobales bacterium]
MFPALSLRIKALIAAMLLLCSAAAYTQSEPRPGAESTQPIRGAPGLALILQTKDGRKEFHFGEAIELRLQYLASQPGWYGRVSNLRLQGGHSWQLRCEPANRTIDRRRTDGRISAARFLHSGEHCGVGSGIGSGTSGHGEVPLGPDPLSYVFTANDEVQFLQPGRYSCTLVSADVASVATGPTEERTAIELTSNPLVFDLKEDHAWSQATLTEALRQFDRAKCVGLPQEGSRCWDPVNTIRLLDTEDSLRALARHYRGVNKEYWQELLWLGILQSQHRQLARELLEQRMTDSDFVVTSGFLETLTAIALQEDHPDAFNEPDEREVNRAYHQPALEILGAYLRQLGESLPSKRSEALTQSLKAYQEDANDTFCEDPP